MTAPHIAPHSAARPIGDDSRLALVDLLERLLDHGVVVAGDLTLSVADVDLVYIGVRALIGAPDRILGQIAESRMGSPT